MNEHNKKKTALLPYLILYTFLFGLICIFVFWRFWKTGTSFVWHTDGWNQHIRALQFYSDWLQQIVRGVIENATLSIPMWSECIGYGSDIVTTLHYYVIGDPLCLLSVFVPDRYMVDFYDAMIIFRLYLAGISFSAFMYYLKKNTSLITDCTDYATSNKKNSAKKFITISAWLAGVFVYLFSGYTFVPGMHHPYFLNPFIYLPFMLIGVEKILKKESPFLFIFMVFLSVVSNFYFFYMIGCNVIIYVLIRLISKYHTNIKKIIQHLLCITGYTITGICAGSFMLIPVLNLLLRTDRASNESSFELLYDSHYYKNFLENFLIPSTSKHHTYMGFSFIVVVCLLLLFMEKKKHTELKVAFVVMTCFLLLPMAGKVLHGFSYTSNRWAFGYVLLLAMITTVEWENLFYLSKKKLEITVAAILIITAGYAIKMHCEDEINRNLQVILCFFILCAGILILSRIDCKKQFIYLQSSFLCILVLSSVIINASFCFDKGGANPTTAFKSVTEVKNYLVSAVDQAALETIEDDDFYRVTSPDSLIKRNSTLQSNLHSTHYYWSLGDKIPQLFFKEMGINSKTDYSYRSLDGRTILNTLVSVKYYITDKAQENTVPYGYTKTGNQQVTTQDGKKEYFIYENTFALPLGYTYDSYITRKEYDELNEIEKEDALIQSILLEQNIDEYSSGNLQTNSCNINYTIENGENILWDGTTFHVKKEKSSITIHLDQKTVNQEIGILWKGLEFQSETPIPNQLNIKINGKLSDDSNISKKLIYLTPNHPRYGSRTDFYINLGWMKENCQEITFTFPKAGDYSLNSLEIYTHSLTNYENEVEERKEDILENVKIGTNQITGNITLNEKKLLCLTIPYSTGWIAFVDGEKTELLQANTMFMALPLSEGNHQITLVYQTPGLNGGIGLTFIGLILIVYLFARQRRKAK